MALVGALGGCQTLGAITGNTGDCAAAETQLATAETAFRDAEAVVLAAGPAASAAQAALAVISADVNAIQALVAQKCPIAPPSNAATGLRARAPTITLGEARELAAKDKALAAGLRP